MHRYFEKIMKSFLYKPNTNKVYWEKIISVIIVGSGLLIFVIYNQRKINKKADLLAGSPRYTIGYTIDHHNNVHGSRTVDYVYYISGKKYENWEHYFTSNAGVSTEGGRYFVKFYSKDASNAKMLLGCPVPSYIKDAPIQGWTQMPIDCEEH